MKHFFVIYFTFSTSLILYSQSENAADSTGKSLEIGLDLKNTLDKNRQEPYSVFLRYNFKRNNGQKSAIRLKAAYNLTVSDSVHIDAFDVRTIKSHRLYVQTGYEWQLQKTNRLLFYYGGDILYTDNLVKYERDYISPNASKMKLFGNHKTKTIGITPLIGIKYKPLPWILFSGEISYRLEYKIQNNFENITLQEYPDALGGYYILQSKIFKSYLIPISQLNICFQLPIIN